MFSTYRQLSLLHAIWNFQVYCSPIITFTCNLKFSSVLFSTDFQLSLLHTKVWNAVLYWHPIITFTCNLKFSSVMFSTYRQLSLLHAKVCNLKMFKCNVLYLPPIITFTCNLKFSSVLFSTDIQLSLLHAISNFQVYCSLLTSNYHFYMQSEIFKCTVLYWHPIITFTCNLKFSSVMFSTYRQ